MISEDILNYSGSFKNIIDQCNYIKSEYNSGEEYHNFMLSLIFDNSYCSDALLSDRKSPKKRKHVPHGSLFNMIKLIINLFLQGWPSG